jgi:hypothetical protein
MDKETRSIHNPMMAPFKKIIQDQPATVEDLGYEETSDIAAVEDHGDRRMRRQGMIKRTMDVSWWETQVSRYIFRKPTKHLCSMFEDVMAKLKVRVATTAPPAAAAAVKKLLLETMWEASEKRWSAGGKPVAGKAELLPVVDLAKARPPVIHLHVRHTDKFREMKLIPLEEYMDQAEKIRAYTQRKALESGDSKSGGSSRIADTIFISTDSQPTLDKLLSSKNYSHWTIIYLPEKRHEGGHERGLHTTLNMAQDIDHYAMQVRLVVLLSPIFCPSYSFAHLHPFTHTPPSLHTHTSIPSHTHLHPFTHTPPPLHTHTSIPSHTHLHPFPHTPPARRPGRGGAGGWGRGRRRRRWRRRRRAHLNGPIAR